MQQIEQPPPKTPTPKQKMSYNVRRGACNKCSCTRFVDEYGSSVCGNCGHANSDHDSY